MLSDSERRLLNVKISAAFRPAAPIDRASLFAGRTTELRRVVDAIMQTGQHVVIYGERGVGKTSLANVLFDLLTEAGVTAIIAPRVNCDVDDTFSSIWRKLFQEIEVQLPVRQLGFLAGSELQKFSLAPDENTPINPNQIRRILRELDQRPIMIVDEFDRVNDPQVRRLFADAVKTMSDHAVDATLIIVGVARDVDALIGEHASIERALVQVQMPRMSREEIAEILQKGEESTGMTITDEAKSYIVSLSQGLPHYAHLLGLYAARSALDERSTEIEKRHVRAAIQVALDNAQQSIIDLYHTATMSSRPESLFEHVLLACALAHVDVLGSFTAASVRSPLQRIMSKRYEIPAFSGHLKAFCDARGPVLEKLGSRRNYRFRFLNPLLQPYVIMWGISRGLISESAIEEMIAQTGVA